MPPLLIAAIAAGAAGLASKGVAAAKGMKGAKYLDALKKEVPQAQNSQYLPLLIGSTQQAMNANPLAAASQRRNQTMMANSIFNARQSTSDPSVQLAMMAGMSGKAADNDMNAQFADEQLKDARRGAYYNALQAGMADESRMFDQKMASINSRANINNAASQTRVNAWNGIGQGFFNVGSMLMGAQTGMDASALNKAQIGYYNKL